MKCPVDSTQLQMTERQGIEIDYCPSCRGVWLDRGELDKLIERSENAVLGRHRQEDDAHQARRERSGDDERGGLLENIFDFI